MKVLSHMSSPCSLASPATNIRENNYIDVNPKTCKGKLAGRKGLKNQSDSSSTYTFPAEHKQVIYAVEAVLRPSEQTLFSYLQKATSRLALKLSDRKSRPSESTFVSPVTVTEICFT